MGKYLIQNGMLVTPRESFMADLLIEDEKISKIAPHIELQKKKRDVKVLDAKGAYILPGAIDVHTHMDLVAGNSRAVDDFYTGTVAAAFGGTTTIVDHVAFGPAHCNLHHQMEVYHKLADDKAVVDYSFHGVLQEVNPDIIAEAKEMVKEGIPSFKAYLTYDNRLGDGAIYQFLEQMQGTGAITAFHAENHEVIEFLRKRYVEEGKTEPIYHAKSRPTDCEAEAIQRILHLAAMAGDAPVYLVHVSSQKGLWAIQEAKAAGQKNIYTETCPQYLTLTEEKYLDPDGLKYVMSPPLRKAADIEALWKGITDGTVDVIATDHCPFHYGKEKQLGKEDFTKCPNGAPGVEERVRLLYTEGVAKGRITMNRMVELLCENPAKIYGLYPQKGALLEGADADLIFYDPSQEDIFKQTDMHSAVDYTAYQGRTVKGRIPLVMQRGKILVEGQHFYGEMGQGQYLLRKRK